MFGNSSKDASDGPNTGDREICGFVRGIDTCEKPKGHVEKGDNTHQCGNDVWFHYTPTQKVELLGGAATSTKVPRFGLIPRKALIAFANRIELGMVRHGEKAWNAQSSNFMAANRDRTWVLERLTHAIDHAMALIAEIVGTEPVSGEDHAGAILFAGGVAACAEPCVWESIKVSVPEPERQPVCILYGHGWLSIGGTQIPVNLSLLVLEEMVKELERQINGR